MYKCLNLSDSSNPRILLILLNTKLNSAKLTVTLKADKKWKASVLNIIQQHQNSSTVKQTSMLVEEYKEFKKLVMFLPGGVLCMLVEEWHLVLLVQECYQEGLCKHSLQ